MKTPKMFAIIAFGCTLSAAAQRPEEPQAAAAPSRSVPLSAGTCAQVAVGDVVTLEWNPAFDDAGAVTGLRNFSLIFAREGEERSALRGHGGLILVAAPARGRNVTPVANAIVSKPNGFFEFSFRVETAQPGIYRLIEAGALAQTHPAFKGRSPEMTNNPRNSSFCLNVAASAEPGRGR